jgi:hypothetical protein
MLLNDEFGNVSSYLLVGNSSDSLLFYCQGVLVKRLHVGARINTVRAAAILLLCRSSSIR